MDAKAALLILVVAIGAAQRPPIACAAVGPTELPMGQYKNYPAARTVTFWNRQGEQFLVVVLRYGLPENAHVSFPEHPRSVQSNFLSPHEYRDVAVVRFQIGDRVDVRSWTWHYTSLKHTLSFGGKTFDLSPPAIAVLGYDPAGKPTLELRPYSAEAAERLPREFGAERRDPFDLPEGREDALEPRRRPEQLGATRPSAQRVGTDASRPLRSRFLRFRLLRRDTGN